MIELLSSHATCTTLRPPIPGQCCSVAEERKFRREECMAKCSLSCVPYIAQGCDKQQDWNYALHGLHLESLHGINTLWLWFMFCKSASFQQKMLILVPIQSPFWRWIFQDCCFWGVECHWNVAQTMMANSLSKRCSKTLVFSVSCFYSEWTDCDKWWWKKQYLQGQLKKVPAACIWGKRLQERYERCCQLKGSLMSLLQGHNVDTTCGLPMTVPWPHAVLTSCLLIHGFAADSSGIGNSASWSRGSTQASTDPSQTWATSCIWSNQNVPQIMDNIRKLNVYLFFNPCFLHIMLSKSDLRSQARSR